VTGIAVVMEIEEVVFDTLGVRANALHGALRAEGVDVPLDAVVAAHAGTTARRALDALPNAKLLDEVVRDLVLRRTTDAVRHALDDGWPAFDTPAHDAVRQLSLDVPMAVVTRASRDDAMRMLEQTGLEVCFRTVLSLEEQSRHEQPAIWTLAASRLFGRRVFAVGPPQVLDGARVAGLVTIAVAASGSAAHHTLASLTQLDASYLASLPDIREYS
jgi:beta-phosphoglucomutase-like phosphatase (HAD superfamily)